MNAELLTILQAVDAQRMKPVEAAEKIEKLYETPRICGTCINWAGAVPDCLTGEIEEDVYYDDCACKGKYWERDTR